MRRREGGIGESKRKDNEENIEGIGERRRIDPFLRLSITFTKGMWIRRKEAEEVGGRGKGRPRRMEDVQEVCLGERRRQ